MIKNTMILRMVFSLMIILAIMSYGPGSAYSQQGDSNIQNLIVNGGFEGGFQEDFGIGYGWGGFSNGNAAVGWAFDDWEAVVAKGKYAQRLEISDAIEHDRYAGIYQTISVIPGEQYKLTIKGLIRSSEGDISVSDYGYRLQYAVDYDGGVAWELVDSAEWKELPWDEQPMSEPTGGAYRQDSFETTITAKGDKLTLFIRGWKKWLNNGSGVYDLDEISFIGPAPEGFQAPVAQEASVGNTEQQADRFVVAVPKPKVVESDSDALPAEAESEAQPESISESEVSAESNELAPSEAAPQVAAPSETGPSVAPNPETAPLPVSGQGDDGSLNYVTIMGGALLLVLLIAATLATTRRRNLVE